MYGGLFGDLPSTKKSKSDDKNEPRSTADTSDGRTATADAKLQDGTSDTSKANKPPTISSLVDKLGTAGTTMAFVPAALRNRKRVLNSTAASSTPSAPPATKRASNIGSDENKTSQSQATQQESTVSLIHSGDTLIESSTSSSVHVQQQYDKGDDAAAAAEESEAMRLLHASVVDVYNPHEPNDLLAYWDRKAMERERLKLERQAKETLERQEHLRQQLEQERQSFLLQQASGNNTNTQASVSASMGRGRGRGVSNLPAWLVQKQQQQQDKLGSNDGAEAEGMNVDEQNPPECTVVLSNLTAPGEVDDELAIEVQEECEEQCGDVTSVVVKDANPPRQPMVQVHVVFRDREDADKAIRVFHGRKFGQRRITAELLAPQQQL